MENSAGTPLAVAINFACHTTVLGPNTLSISGDFPYFTARHLQESLALADLNVLFFNGAEGDISVGHKSDLSAVGVIAPSRTFDRAEELGRQLGEVVGAALPDLQVEESGVRVITRTLALPLKQYADPEVMAERRRDALSAIAQLADGDMGEAALKIRQNGLFTRIEEYYSKLYAASNQPPPKNLEVPVTVIKIGRTAIVTFPGEVFVSIGLQIRQQSPFGKLCFWAWQTAISAMFLPRRKCLLRIRSRGISR